MHTENPANKTADIGEEDLVDYEEEDDTTVEKPSDASKENANKYASTSSFFIVSLSLP